MVNKIKYLAIIIFLLSCGTTKNLRPLHYNKPIPSFKQAISFRRTPYIEIKYKNEYIQYNENYKKIQYYSNVEKRINVIILLPTQCLYDGFMIQGDDQFRNDIIESLFLLEKNCLEEYDTIRNGIIDDKNTYHKGISIIRQSKDHPVKANKKANEVLLGTQRLKEKTDKDYYKLLAASIAGEGYRLIYWDEWGPLPAWWDKKEGIKLQYRVLKKLKASSSKLEQMEKALEQQDEDLFYRRLHEE